MTWAIEPPPAPIDSTSTEGARTGNSPTFVSRVIVGVPSRQTATSVEVPPMSKVRMLSKPERFATNDAPPTPPAGPERTVCTGISIAASTLIRPPSERITCTSEPAPSSWRRLLRLPR